MASLCPAWYLPLFGSSAQNVQAIQVLVNKVVRHELHIKKSDKVPAQQILHSANLLTVKQAYVQFMITLTWNTLKHKKNGLQDFFQQKTPEDGLPTTRVKTRGDHVFNY